MRELAVQSSNDTNNERDRGFLDLEFQQLKNEIDRIGQNTQWNGSNILDGTGGNKLNGAYAFQVGANSNQTITLKLPNMQTAPAVKSGATVAIDTTTSPAVMSFTGFDTVPQDQAGVLGVVVQATFAGKAVQYKITQDDIDLANAATPVKLSVTIANALQDKLDTPLWNRDYKAEVVADKLQVSPIGSAPALTDTGVNANVEAKFVQGDLSDIATAGITSADSAYKALQSIDSVLQTVNADRSNMGALISRLQFASDNLFSVMTKATESRSRIEDTDYSQATTELAKRNIIQQAAQAMLAQANQAPQMVLQLLK
jgi:flagellin